MSRMADRSGADLELALQSGLIAPDEMHDAVLACSGCANPGACEEYMDNDAVGIPAFCRNGEMIERGARLMSSAD